MSSNGGSAPGVEILDHAHRHEPHVEIREPNPDEACPGKLHVPSIEPRNFFPSAVLRGLLTARHAVVVTTDEVAKRVATEGVAGDEDGVDCQDNRAHADAELAVFEVGQDCVVAEDHDEDEGEVERVAVQVLEHHEEAFAVVRARLRDGTDGTTWWRTGEGAVIRFAVVVTGKTEGTGKREDEDRGRCRDKRGQPRGPTAEKRVLQRRGTLNALHAVVREEHRRIKRAQVRFGIIELPLETGPRCVDDERAETEERDQRSDPPVVGA